MSYEKYGLDDTEKVIFFQEISQEDMDIATKFGYHWFGSHQNLGIAAGYTELVKYATGEFFLFLENDWELIEPASEYILHSQDMLTEGGVDVVRLRHRKNHGWPLWTAQFKNKELTRPEHLLDSVHWLDHPEDITNLVGCAETIPEGRFNYHFTTAKYANWTNNPTMFRTDWLREHIVPRMGNRDLEKDIQGWWQNQEFIVAQGEGLFTHNRLD